jgi:hypothetical protein
VERVFAPRRAGIPRAPRFVPTGAPPAIEYVQRVPSRVRYVLLPLVVALTLALGFAKLVRQREHPPDWARNESNSYAGYVAIDGYAQRAETLRDALRSGEGPAALIDVFRVEHHANVIVTPLCVAVLALLTGDVIPAFVLVAALALLVTALATVGIAREVARAFSARDRGSEEVVWITAVLCVSHVLVARTAVQLQLDGVHTALVALATLVSLRTARTQRFVGGALLLGLIHTAGLLNKYAYLPALAIPALVEFACGSRNPGRALVLALSAAAPAMFVLGLWVRTVAGSSGPVGDFEHLAGTWNFGGRQLGEFALEMVLLLQAWPVLLWLARGERSARETALVACLVLWLVSVWVFRLPAVPRLYLPAVVPLVALAGAFVARRWDLARVRRAFYALVALNYAAAIAGVLAG